MATEFEGIAPCLLDCSDPVRIQRLGSRGWDSHVPEIRLRHWAAWMRQHATDPQYREDVLLWEGAAELRWDRWIGWHRGDQRWQVTVIDHTDESPIETAGRLSA